MTTYTVTSPDGIETHTGSNKAAAIKAARALAAKHVIGGRTVVSAGDERIALFVREESGVQSLTP